MCSKVVVSIWFCDVYCTKMPFTFSVMGQHRSRQNQSHWMPRISRKLQKSGWKWNCWQMRLKRKLKIGTSMPRMTLSRGQRYCLKCTFKWLIQSLTAAVNVGASKIFIFCEWSFLHSSTVVQHVSLHKGRRSIEDHPWFVHTSGVFRWAGQQNAQMRSRICFWSAFHKNSNKYGEILQGARKCGEKRTFANSGENPSPLPTAPSAGQISNGWQDGNFQQGAFTWI